MTDQRIERLVDGEVKTIRFQFVDAFGSAKDVSGDTYNLRTLNQDGDSCIYEIQDSSFDTHLASDGIVTVNYDSGELNGEGLYKAEVEREEPQSNGENDKFQFLIRVVESIEGIC